MIHYTYKIINSQTGEYYIGVRSTNTTPECDCYMGSSSIWTKSYIQKYKSILCKEILNSSYVTRKDAENAERVLITECINDPLCINLCIPGEDFTMFSKPCAEWRKRYYSKLYTGSGNPFYNKHHSEETKEKIRNTIGDSRKLDKNAFFGKKHTEESIKLNREKHIGINNQVSLPVKYTNLETNEVLYFGSINLCVKYIGGSWVPFKKQMMKKRPYKKIHFAEFITKEEYALHNT